MIADDFERLGFKVVSGPRDRLREPRSLDLLYAGKLHALILHNSANLIWTLVPPSRLKVN